MHIIFMGKSWIEARLSERSKSKTDLGKALGLPPSRITEIINGTRKIHLDEVVPLATFLELPPGAVVIAASMTPEEFSGELEYEHIPGMDPIYIRGAVKAGAFVEQTELPLDEQEYIYAPAPTGKYLDLYGLRVEGDSMNKVYRPGTILIVAHLLEYFGPYQSGMKVICQRERNGEFETTVKELEIKDDQYWLWPRSDNPEHQSPIKIPPPRTWSEGEENEFEYRVIGVVVSSYTSELPIE